LYSFLVAVSTAVFLLEVAANVLLFLPVSAVFQEGTLLLLLLAEGVAVVY
jgi:hypothetical protein